LSEEYLASLEKITSCTRPLVSEYKRKLIRALVMNDLDSFEQLRKGFETDKISRFYDYCINCERSLASRDKMNHFFQHRIEVFELKFCCSCYEKFKDKSLTEFPDALIEKINNKVRQFRKAMK
jgi:hypothetical protein